jgi:hypothetical protein
MYFYYYLYSCLVLCPTYKSESAIFYCGRENKQIISETKIVDFSLFKISHTTYCWFKLILILIFQVTEYLSMACCYFIWLKPSSDRLLLQFSVSIWNACSQSSIAGVCATTVAEEGLVWEMAEICREGGMPPLLVLAGVRETVAKLHSKEEEL